MRVAVTYEYMYSEGCSCSRADRVCGKSLAVASLAVDELKN